MIRSRLIGRNLKTTSIIWKRFISVRETKRLQELQKAAEKDGHVKKLDEFHIKPFQNRILNDLILALNQKKLNADVIHSNFILLQSYEHLSWNHSEIMIKCLLFNRKFVLPDTTVKLDSLIRYHGQTFEVPTEYFYKLISNYQYLQNGRAMESMLQFMIDNNLVLTDSIITLFLKLYARDGPPESANNLIRYCAENDYQILPKYYDYVVIAYCNNLEPWKALEVIKQAQFDSFPITEHMLIAILSSFAKLKNKSGVAYVLKIVEEKQLPPSQELYTAMMNAYKFINQSENVLVIFNKMNELSETDDSMKPSTYAYSILLDMYSKIEDSGAARSALQQMIEQGKEVNAVHFHSVMDSCRKANDSDTVLVLYEQMKSLGLKPVQETFSILLSTYGFKGDLEKMKKVYDEMVSFNIYPNRFTIGTIISIYMKNSNFQECHHWYKTLESRGMYPSPAILSTMMQCVVLEKREFKDCEFYYQIGESLGIVNLQLIKEFVICDLILNKNIKSSIQLMLEQIKKHDIKIDQTSIDIFSNAILKPKLYQPEFLLNRSFSNTPIDVNSPVVDGKEQFMMLRKSLESDKLGGQSQNMYDLALSKLR
ncbi:hypothetical protein BC833DRAFT_622783 [Globomyces pollinis-pini]|nr:hypothetical protein BC833DRAFT_622783 [Globomyces pollinis-pini]